METLFNETLKTTKEIQSFWENRMSQLMEESVRSQTFIQAMGKSLESAIDGRKTFQTFTSRWAEMFDLVTKKDIDNLSRMMYEQNVKLDRIVQILEKTQNGKKTAN